MQANYLSRLSQPVQGFVEEVEFDAGLTIEVEEDATLNGGGPEGRGSLQVNIEPNIVRLIAPTNGYFPDGGVRHEALHVRRLLVESVPRLSLAEAVHWDQGLEESLTIVDNELEHFVIVPIELRYHPERKAHWESIVVRSWRVDLPQALTPLDRRIGACLRWVFLRHVMAGSPSIDGAQAFLDAHDLRAEAESFYNRVVPVLEDKLSLVKLLFDWFGDLPRDRAGLEYVSSITGTRFAPIPK